MTPRKTSVEALEAISPPHVDPAVMTTVVHAADIASDEMPATPSRPLRHCCRMIQSSSPTTSSRSSTGKPFGRDRVDGLGAFLDQP